MWSKGGQKLSKCPTDLFSKSGIRSLAKVPQNDQVEIKFLTGLENGELYLCAVRKPQHNLDGAQINEIVKIRQPHVMHDLPVNSIDFLNDTKLFVTCSDDSTAKISKISDDYNTIVFF